MRIFLGLCVVKSWLHCETLIWQIIRLMCPSGSESKARICLIRINSIAFTLKLHMRQKRNSILGGLFGLLLNRSYNLHGTVNSSNWKWMHVSRTTQINCCLSVTALIVIKTKDGGTNASKIETYSYIFLPFFTVFYYSFSFWCDCCY